ncbi:MULTISPECIES: methylenetetrahydrofolate reductase [Streptomyces]|uniref:Methylenetetrahydrofolate reductase n=1 Tax=Streptomyces thermoviolaceus subsp. thermoviolaceus TaxID=66860 RepID=A0ABX0YW63_STRTL|nr:MULTISPECIES: methylenetetrahydrofolate reductase [Streptomyces]WTD50657.1 methylenetetrahydrofolate reductase [Streptomyces thermoviolaceus]NJP15345.1 5,10-methylenetetrahydrofolate reductase [Streptomyces thermoviolaceus subsp. thermoviolaceus]RSR99402.1 5,10-methylenetetrahydrofolate reductase [Streptomyces sp. WAC00469]GGV76292.1 methylenetetrahydrofolate reductase [Streptomyces thermoviolaceus subsp. apingens]GHB11566.1 methylenetetrahydrofolate reductase [Streptomyces thermoviolaceus 
MSVDEKPPTVRAGLTQALRTMGYEVLPFKSTFDKVTSSVPTCVPLSVTASPGKTIGTTVDLAIALADKGYSVTPHLAARMVTSRTELKEIGARLADSPVTSIFVVGGDAQQAGPYGDALSLLRDIREGGFEFDAVGIGGYPEGHALIDDGTLSRALAEKAAYADYIVTQICFSPGAISRWADALARSGITLPVRVGVPGAVSREKLLRITADIGIGNSARFLRKQRDLLYRFFVPGGYRPDRIIDGLRRDIDAPTSPLSTFHVFTFNEVEKTEAWRQETLRRLGASGS